MNALLPLIAVLGAAIVGFLGYRRGRSAAKTEQAAANRDAIVEVSRIDAATDASTEQRANARAEKDDAAHAEYDEMRGQPSLSEKDLAQIRAENEARIRRFGGGSGDGR